MPPATVIASVSSAPNGAVSAIAARRTSASNAAIASAEASLARSACRRAIRRDGEQIGRILARDGQPGEAADDLAGDEHAEEGERRRDQRAAPRAGAEDDQGREIDQPQHDLEGEVRIAGEQPPFLGEHGREQPGPEMARDRPARGGGGRPPRQAHARALIGVEEGAAEHAPGRGEDGQADAEQQADRGGVAEGGAAGQGAEAAGADMMVAEPAEQGLAAAAAPPRIVGDELRDQEDRTAQHGGGDLADGARRPRPGDRRHRQHEAEAEAGAD